MKVHFSTPLRDLEEHLNTYEIVEKSIKSAGHSIVRDWLEGYRKKRAASTHLTDEQWKEANARTLVAIKEADAVIVEASIPSFSMGYIAAEALANKKPLLILSSRPGQPHIIDSTNSLKRAEVYRSDTELQEVVATFLKDVDVDANNLRFNMVIDREIYSFLNWESVNTGKSKAQIIRQVLKRHIKHRE